MQALTPEYIAQLAHLARLELTAEEEQRFTGQLGAVIEYVEQLDTVSAGQTTAEPTLRNVFMEDAPRPAKDLCNVPREALLAGAPAHQDGLIEVRAVMGDEIVGA